MRFIGSENVPIKNHWLLWVNFFTFSKLDSISRKELTEIVIPFMPIVTSIPEIMIFLY